MRTQRSLRITVTAHLVLMAVLFTMIFWESATLPYLLPEEPNSTMVTRLGEIALLGSLIGCGAILKSRKWGAWLHLASTVIGLLVVASIEPQIISPMSAVVDSLIMISAGLIYGLVFFTGALTAKPSS